MSKVCEPPPGHRITAATASLRDIRSSGQNYVRLRALKSRGEECQTHNCQQKSINIGDKSQSEK